MYQTTDALHAALNSQRLHLRITHAGADPIADVLKLTYSASCCAGDSIGIGNVCAAAVTAKLAGKQMLENTAILVEVGAEVDGEIQYVPFGSFVVSEQQHEEDVTSVTAYDAVYYALGGTYLPADPAPTTALAVLRDICAQTGLELAASNGQNVPIVGEAIVGEAVVGGAEEMPDVDISGDLTGKSCREMVGCMAALLGCNALVDRDGKLRLLWFADSGLTLTADDYYSGGLVLEGTVTLAGISVNKTTRTTTVDEDGVTSETETTETLRAGEGSGTVMELDNEFCDQSIVDAVWAAIGGLGTYQI